MSGAAEQVTWGELIRAVNGLHDAQKYVGAVQSGYAPIRYRLGDAERGVDHACVILRALCARLGISQDDAVLKVSALMRSCVAPEPGAMRTPMKSEPAGGAGPRFCLDTAAVETALGAVVDAARDVTPTMSDDALRAMLERRLAGAPYPEVSR